MTIRRLDPRDDADLTQILAHKTEITIKKTADKGSNPNIKIGDTRTGIAKIVKIGEVLELVGSNGCKTSDLCQITQDPDIKTITLQTQNSAYKIVGIDPGKIHRVRSVAFLKDGYLKEDKLMPDGFYDGGRDTRFEIENDKLEVISQREIILLDSRTDPNLQKMLQESNSILSGISDPKAKIQTLALYVSTQLGGQQAVDLDNIDIEVLSNKAIAQAQKRLPSKNNAVRIGDLSYGVCRHRALLFKYLADRNGIKSRLVRGDYRGSVSSGGHQWNVVELNGKYYVVDVMHNPAVLSEESDRKAQNYFRKGLAPAFGGFGGRSIKK